VVRQLFYLSETRHYQCAQDNPVVDVFTTQEAAKDLARRIIKSHIESSKGYLHIVEDTPDSELVYKVGAFDCSGLCEYSYSVIKKGMLV
jgi:hypothetical protein